MQYFHSNKCDVFSSGVKLNSGEWCCSAATWLHVCSFAFAGRHDVISLTEVLPNNRRAVSFSHEFFFAHMFLTCLCRCSRHDATCCSQIQTLQSPHGLKPDVLSPVLHSSDLMTSWTQLQLQHRSASTTEPEWPRTFLTESLRVRSARVSLHMETQHLSRLLRYVYRACWYRDDDKFTIYRAALAKIGTYKKKLKKKVDMTITML